MFEQGYYFDVEHIAGVYEYRIWKTCNNGTPPIRTGRKNSSKLAKKQALIVINQLNEREMARLESLKS